MSKSLLETYNKLHYGNSTSESNPEMEELYEILDVQPDLIVDVDSAWNGIRPVSRQKFPWMKLAASVALVAVVGLYIFSRYYQKDIVQLTAADSVTEYSLPDGSKITLNSGSKLTYEKGNPRAVALFGKGFFSVKKSQTEKFIVSTGEASVEVLGTEFEINANQEEVSVFVTSGSVSFGINSDRVLLESNMKAVIDLKSNKLVTDKNPDKNQLSWYSKRFEFDDHNMSRVVETLENHFDVDIDLKNQDAGKCKITGTFSDENILDILNSICSLLDLKLQQKDNRFVLKGKGC